MDYSLTTISEVLRESGYATAAVAGAYVVADGSGIEQGFDHYDSDFGGGDEVESSTEPLALHDFKTMRRGDEVTERAINWLNNSERPFFLVVHYWDPHDPYEPPQVFRERWPDNPYVGEVAFTDSQIGLLLEAAGDAAGKENLITALVADHGEGLGQHKEQYHGIFVYDSTLLVPLIIHSPGLVSEGLVIEEQVSTIDLAPTVLELAGMPVPDTWQGQSFAEDIGYDRDLSGFSLVEDASASETQTAHSTGPRPCYIETYRTRYSYQWSELVGVRHDGWKLVRAPRPELYDLAADPLELNNLYNEAPDKVLELESIFENMIAEHSGPLGDMEPATDLDEEKIEKLKSLGYVMSSKRAATDQLPDPKDKIDEEILRQRVREKVLSARILLNEGNEDAAKRQLESALELNPEDPDALEQLGMLLWRRGNRERGLNLLEDAARVAPESTSPQFNLGIAYMQLGRYKDAVAQFRTLVSLDPENADSRYRYGKALQLMGDSAGALEQYSVCLELNPSMTLAIYDSSVLLVEAGRSAEARERLGRLLNMEIDGELARAARALLIRIDREQSP
jgi:tetratricopeptide (TPR) repeat protein